LKKNILLILLSLALGYSKQIEPTTTDLMIQYFFDLQEDTLIPGLDTDTRELITNHATIDNVKRHSSLFITVLFNAIGFKLTQIESGYSDTLTVMREIRYSTEKVNEILFSMIDYPCYDSNVYDACRMFSNSRDPIGMNTRSMNSSDELTYSVIQRLYQFPDLAEFSERKAEIKKRVQNISWSTSPYSTLDSIRLLALTPLDSSEQARTLIALTRYNSQTIHVPIDEWVYIRLGDTTREDSFINRFLSVEASESNRHLSFDQMITHISLINTERSTNALLYQFLKFEHAGVTNFRDLFMEGLDRNLKGMDGYHNYFTDYIMVDSENSELKNEIFADYLRWISSRFDINRLIN